MNPVSFVLFSEPSPSHPSLPLSSLSLAQKWSQSLLSFSLVYLNLQLSLFIELYSSKSIRIAPFVLLDLLPSLFSLELTSRSSPALSVSYVQVVSTRLFSIFPSRTPKEQDPYRYRVTITPHPMVADEVPVARKKPGLRQWAMLAIM